MYKCSNRSNNVIYSCFNSLFKIFNNSSGATAAVTQGAEIVLDGTYTRPPNGTYTHGYAYMDNTFGITWAGELSGAKQEHLLEANGSGTHAKGKHSY